MANAYFTPATFRFLRALDRNNNREWFLAHKPEYERDVRDPFLQLIADMQAPLLKISAHYRADSRKNGGSLFRIHRDTRFSNDKQPYKPWQGARFFHERRHVASRTGCAQTHPRLPRRQSRGLEARHAKQDLPRAFRLLG